MRHLCCATIVVALMPLAAGAWAIQFGKAAPKVMVYRPSDTQVVVYDARPEFAVCTNELGGPARQALRDAGIRLVRCTLSWDRMESTDKPGLYDSKYLAAWDSLVEDCRKAGIHLDVVITGDPPGVGYDNRIEAWGRLTAFAADMAARYPSVLYWELLDAPDSDSTCILGAKDGASVRERGANYAVILRQAYAAIKAANPAASLVCGGSADDEFLRGLYERGRQNCFDILGLRCSGTPRLSAFVERAGSARKIADENGDEAIPLWNLGCASQTGSVVDELTTGDWEDCLLKNAEQNLYQKVVWQTTPGGPAWKRLHDAQANAVIVGGKRTITNVFVPTASPMAPVGYDYRDVEGGIEIQRVVVDTLLPTRISLIYLGETQTSKPGIAPQPPRKKGTRPIPDPFDI